MNLLHGVVLRRTMKKQASFWLPSWKNTRQTSADQPQKSDPVLPQTEPKKNSPVKDQQQPPSPNKVAASDPQFSSLLRSRRPSPSTVSSSPVRRSQPVPLSSSLSRVPSEKSEVAEELIRKVSGEPSTSGGDDAKGVQRSKVNALSQSLPLESKALPSKESPPNEPLSRSKSQSKRLNLDKGASKKESSNQAEVADLPKEKSDSREVASFDPLGRSGRVKSGHAIDPTTQNPNLETEPGTRHKSVKEQEQDQTPTVERRLGKSEFYGGGVEAIPTLVSDIERSSFNSEISKKEKRETEPDSQTQAAKNRSTKDSTTTTTSKPMKEVRSSQREEEEEEEENKNSTKNSSKRKEVNASNSSTNQRASTFNGLQKEIKNDMPKFAQKLGIRKELQQTDGERSICIITLAGENKGASMVIDHHQPTTSEVPISIFHKSSYNTPDQQNLEEEKDKKKSSDSKRNYGTHTSINSNTQSINNSILQNSSCCERSPGVYFILNDGLRSEPFSESLPLAHKPKQNSIFPTQKPVNESTTVRRRCLRGLLAETSESSDEGKPKKPQRHGCRFKCGEKAEW